MAGLPEDKPEGFYLKGGKEKKQMEAWQEKKQMEAGQEKKQQPK